MTRSEAHRMTIREAYMQASSFLKQKPESQQDAQHVTMLLLQHVLGMDQTALLLNWDAPFPEDALRLWQQAIKRKSAGEPVQYIIGESQFYGLPFTVNPDVLIPRPETELLVEAVLQRADQFWSNPVLIDVGTGSGALAVTFAHERPNWQVHGSDISDKAIKVALENAKRNSVDQRIVFHHGDLLTPFIQQRLHFDILVSNPPYIPSGELDSLQTEVRHFEPTNALLGGKDGLEPYRRMVDMLQQCAQLPHMIAFEHGQGQANAIEEMMKQLPYRCERIKDLAGIDRHVIAIRN